MLRPDVVVLGAGGILGEAWMNGVIAGMAAGGIDVLAADAFVGTSAGSIVAARLSVGELPTVSAFPQEVPSAPKMKRTGQEARATLEWEAPRWTVAHGGRLTPLALRASAPAGALFRARLLRRIPRAHGSLMDLGRRVERFGATFDGRLLVVAVDRARGRRVVFGAGDAPATSVARAVQASCSIPGVYRPVMIDGREYVDGGVWSPTNLDLAPAKARTVVLCLTPAGRQTAELRSRRGLLRAYQRSALALETAALRHRGAHVQAIGPDDSAAEAMGEDLMDAGPRAAVEAAGYLQGQQLGGD